MGATQFAPILVEAHMDQPNFVFWKQSRHPETVWIRKAGPGDHKTTVIEKLYGPKIRRSFDFEPATISVAIGSLTPVPPLLVIALAARSAKEWNDTLPNH